MRNRSTGIFVAAATTLAACVPLLPQQYHEPAAPGGEILVNPCWGRKDHIVFKQEGVEVRAGIITAKRGPLLEVMFRVPEGKRVVLADAGVSVVNERTAVAGAAAPAPLPFLGLSSTGNPELPMMKIAPLAGGYFDGNPNYPWNYWLYAPLAMEQSDPLRVVLPSFSVNGHTVALPEIRFAPQTHVQVMAPLQC